MSEINHFIDEQLITKEYYLKHMSMFLKETYGIDAHLELMIDWIKGIDEMALYLPKVLNVWDENYKKELLEQFKPQYIYNPNVKIPVSLRGKYAANVVKIEPTEQLFLDTKYYANIPTPYSEGLYQENEFGNIMLTTFDDTFIENKDYYSVREISLDNNLLSPANLNLFEYYASQGEDMETSDTNFISGKSYFKFIPVPNNEVTSSLNELKQKCPNLNENNLEASFSSFYCEQYVDGSIKKYYFHFNQETLDIIKNKPHRKMYKKIYICASKNPLEFTGDACENGLFEKTSSGYVLTTDTTFSKDKKYYVCTNRTDGIKYTDFVYACSGEYNLGKMEVYEKDDSGTFFLSNDTDVNYEKDYYEFYECKCAYIPCNLGVYYKNNQKYYLSTDSEYIPSQKYYYFYYEHPHSLGFYNIEGSKIEYVINFDWYDCYFKPLGETTKVSQNITPKKLKLYRDDSETGKYILSDENEFDNTKIYRYRHYNQSRHDFVFLLYTTDNGAETGPYYVSESYAVSNMLATAETFEVSNSRIKYSNTEVTADTKLSEYKIAFNLNTSSGLWEQLEFIQESSNYLLWYTSTSELSLRDIGSTCSYMNISKLSTKYSVDPSYTELPNSEYEEFKILDLIGNIVGAKRVNKIFIKDEIDNVVGHYEIIKLSNVDLLEVIKIKIIQNSYQGTLQELLDLYSTKLGYQLYISLIDDNSDDGYTKSASCNVYCAETTDNAHGAEKISDNILKLFKYSDLFIQSVGINYNRAILSDIDVLLLLDKEYEGAYKMALYRKDDEQTERSIVLG